MDRHHCHWFCCWIKTTVVIAIFGSISPSLLPLLDQSYCHWCHCWINSMVGTFIAVVTGPFLSLLHLPLVLIFDGCHRHYYQSLLFVVLGSAVVSNCKCRYHCSDHCWHQYDRRYSYSVRGCREEGRGVAEQRPRRGGPFTTYHSWWST